MGALGGALQRTYGVRQSMRGGDLFIGQILDRRPILYRNLLKSLALPRGLEPLFSP